MAGVVYTDFCVSKEFINVENVIKSSVRTVSVDRRHDDVEEYCASFKKQTGLDKISCIPKEQVIEKYEEMLKRMFEKTDIKPNEISYFIAVDLYSNASNDISICSYLQKKYKIENATMFSLHQGCGSTLISMGLARKLLDNNNKYMLIISSCFAPSFEGRFIGTTVVGDALGLMVISHQDSKFEIVDSISVSDGQISFDAYNGIEFKPDVVSVVVKGVGVIKQLISRNGLTMEDIQHVIPQSINYQKYSGLYAKMLGIKSEQMFLDNIAKGGHLGDVDIMRNFHDYFGSNALLKDKYYLLYGIGGPQGKDKSYNAVLVRVND